MNVHTLLLKSGRDYALTLPSIHLPHKVIVGTGTSLPELTFQVAILYPPARPH